MGSQHIELRFVFYLSSNSMDKLTKKELLHIASAMGINNCANKTKKEIVTEIHGGAIIRIRGIGYDSKFPKLPNSRKGPNVSSKAIATGVEMMKDELTSTLAKSVLQAKGVGSRAVSAFAAASDATNKIRESIKSDERKRKR